MDGEINEENEEQTNEIKDNEINDNVIKDDEEGNNDGNDDVENSESDDDDNENIFCSSSDSSSDENDEYDVNSVLEIIATLNKIKNKRIKKKTTNKSYSLVKKFLKTDLNKRSILYDKYHDQITRKLKYIAKNIVNEKIPVKTSDGDKYILEKFINNKYKKADHKILLVENFYLNTIFERALSSLEKYKNEQASGS